MGSEELDKLVEDMFDNYIEGGFDFNTSQSLHDIFKGIFKDAVKMTIDVYENEEDEE